MFWEQLTGEEANITDLIKQREMTVLEVIDHPSTPQEVKFMSEELFSFFNSKERLSELFKIALSKQKPDELQRSDTAVQILKSNNGNFLPMLLSDEENVNFLCNFLDADKPIDWFAMSMLGALVSAALEYCPSEMLTMLNTREEVIQLLMNRIAYPVVAKMIAEMIVTFGTNRGVPAALGQSCFDKLLVIEKLPALVDIPDAQFALLFEQIYIQWRDYLVLNDELQEIPPIRTILSSAFIDQLCAMMFRPSTSAGGSEFPYVSERVYIECCGAMCSIVKMAVSQRDFRLGRRTPAEDGPLDDVAYDDCEALTAIIQKSGSFFSFLELAHGLKRESPPNCGVPPFANAYFATMRLFVQLAQSNARAIDEAFGERIFDIIAQVYRHYCMNCYALDLANTILLHLSCSGDGDGPRDDLTPLIGILLISGQIFKFILEARERSVVFLEEHGRLPASYDYVMPIASKVDDILRDGAASIFQLPDSEYSKAWKAFVETDLKPYQKKNTSSVKRVPVVPLTTSDTRPLVDAVAEQFAQKRSEFIMQVMNNRIPEVYGVSVESNFEDNDTENKFKTPPVTKTFVDEDDFQLSLDGAILIDDDEDVATSCILPGGRLTPCKKSKLVRSPCGVAIHGANEMGKTDKVRCPGKKSETAVNDEKARSATAKEHPTSGATNVPNGAGSAVPPDPFASSAKKSAKNGRDPSRMD